MKESTITAKIMRELKVRGIYAVKIQGNAYQQPGLPDIWCVVKGRLVCLEVKNERGIVSKIQRVQMTKLQQAGAVAEVVRSVDDAMIVVEGVLPIERFAATSVAASEEVAIGDR